MEGAMPQSMKLTELTIKETSGVDHPAHLHEGWMVMKSDDDLDISLNQIITEPDNQENIVELQATPEVAEVAEEVTEELPTVEVTEVAASVDGPDLVAKELTDLRKQLTEVTDANKALVQERGESTRRDGCGHAVGSANKLPRGASITEA